MTTASGRPAHNRKLPPDDTILAMLGEGLSHRQIAARCGVNRNGIDSLVRERGWSKAETRRGREAANRKLPDDDTFAAHLRARMPRAEIAARYGVSVTAVYKRILAITARDPRVLMPVLEDSPSKVVTTRQGFADPRDFAMALIRISLPRVPTLHGHFEGA